MPKWLLTVLKLAANGKLNKMPNEKLIFQQSAKSPPPPQSELRSHFHQPKWGAGV